MRQIRVLFCAIVVMFASVDSLRADMVLYNNGDLLHDVGDTASQFSGPPATSPWLFESAVADDFSIPGSVPSVKITEVRSVFSFFNGVPAGTTVANTFDSVRVSIFANALDDRPDSALNGAGGFTGNVIADALVDVSQVSSSLAETVGGTDFFEVNIPVNLQVATNTIYWLSIVPHFPAPPQALWAISDQNNGFSAHNQFPAVGITDWTPINGNYQNVAFPNAPAAGTHRDVVFQLHGVPEPATLSLLAFGILAIRRRR